MISDFKIHDLFSIPLMKCTVKLPHDEISEYVREKLRKHGNYTSYFDNEYNHRMQSMLPWRDAMEKTMRFAAKSFLKKMEIDPRDCPDILNYWFSSYNGGDDHVLHSHPFAVVAGTYYPYADQDSTKIQYRNPNAIVLSHSEPGDRYKFLYHTHYPTTGEMNLWPAWLEHQVRPQQEVNPERSRIAISFNYGTYKNKEQ